MELLWLPWRRTCIYFVIVWFLGYESYFVQAECERISISNTLYQGVREGTYGQYPQDCHGKASYKQEGTSDPNYIFYVATVDGWNGWMIGSTWCQNKGGMAVQDEADFPDEVTNTWEEVYNSDWFYSYDAKVKCAGLSGGAIAGIVIGVIIVAVVMIIIAACCCQKNNKRSRQRRNSVQVISGQRQQVSSISYANRGYSRDVNRPNAQRPPPGHPQGQWYGPTAGAPPYGQYTQQPVPYYNMPPPGYPPSQSDPYASLGPPPAYSEVAQHPANTVAPPVANPNTAPQIHVQNPSAPPAASQYAQVNRIPSPKPVQQGGLLPSGGPPSAASVGSRSMGSSSGLRPPGSNQQIQRDGSIVIDVAASPPGSVTEGPPS